MTRTAAVMPAERVVGGYRDALASVTALSDVSTVVCSDAELVEVTRLTEELSRRVEALTVARYADNLQRRPGPMITSVGSVHGFYEQALNVGRGETNRRREHAGKLAAGQTPSGETIAPTLPDTAEALRAGQISRTHVDVIIKTMRKIPTSVSPDVVASAEASMAEFATQLTPRELENVGARLLAYLDPDGQVTDEQDRVRQRDLYLSSQDQQLMSTLTGHLTPAGRAVVELAMELFAAKGMNNPDDPDSPRGAVNAPGVDPHVLAEAAKRDRRTAGQRRHDALIAICAHASASTDGTLNGLPAHIVVTASKKDMEDGRGFATTATGSTVPVTDVIDLVMRDPGTGEMVVVVFDDDTSDVIFYGTGRRSANTAQRFASFGRDRGCTKPKCRESMFGSQAHHVRRWENGGRTTIGNLGAACGHDNRREGPLDDQWKTVIIPDGPDKGRVGWIDPADPDRIPRVNNTFFPEIILRRTWNKHHRGPTTPSPPQRE
ncbi:DUF222 domain-containing protein [Gordonia sp. TBRC 11910]|uniref:DUF222 domain-containing protein n=1 Tax=Gordonia asplenii TaxID=2725283 RepID=A0A848KY21_9ACTN|nr:HNH endonuclease signature motif containing protein [Gordonia asplenii]NMO03249.1 DUF222 domain-containing protein [Gordonia asplenii]